MRVRRAFIELESSSVWKMRMLWGRQESVLIFPGMSRAIKTSVTFGASPRNPGPNPQGHRNFHEQQSVQENIRQGFQD